MAALIIGVIVAGLGIGALISAFQNRGTPPPELGATSMPVVTPVPQPSAPPPLATFGPVPPPSPTPTPLPTHAAKPKPSPTATASVTPLPSPSASAVATVTPFAAPSPSAHPLSSPAAVRPAAVAVAPSPPPSAVPVVRPPPTASTPLPPYAHPAVPAGAGDAAVAVARRYINDLIAGDEAGASATLSDRSLGLKEEAILGKDARITSIRATGTDASGTMVDAEIMSNGTSYEITFHVTNGPSGSIDKHDYIKI